MIDSIRLSNFLSFGYSSEEIQLNPLNVIIGTNASGKSNFLEAFDLLRCAPSDITKPIREGGGVSDWLYKGNSNNLHENAVLDVVVKNGLQRPKYNEIRYVIEFNAAGQQFGIFDEKIVSKEPDPGMTAPYIFYDFANGRPTLNIFNEGAPRKLQIEDIDATQSILVQKRDDIHYPEITHLAQNFRKIRMYREWNFGRYTPARLPQKVDLPNNHLEPDCSNLGLVLNLLTKYNGVKEHLLKELQFFYGDVVDYGVDIVGTTVQLFFKERGLKSHVPATRLSDGTLRYLCLLAILCHPAPPPFICIEEPELGLHPDVLPNLAKLLISASERSQLIVTTHSEMLVDAFTSNPEAVLVAEKGDNGTELTRLNAQQLKPWLEKYRLGQLWTRGDIGGTRW